MPNEYSIQFHDFLTSRIAHARHQAAEAEQTGDEQSRSFWNGQLDELRWLRSYLKEHIDLKDFTYYQPDA